MNTLTQTTSKEPVRVNRENPKPDSPNGQDGGSGRVSHSEAEPLAGAARAMHATLRLGELYEIVVRTVATLTESEGAILLLHRPRTHHPVIFKMWLRDTDAPVDLPSSVGRTFIHWLEGRPLSTGSFSNTLPAVEEAIAQAVGDRGATAERWVPLVHRARTMGAIGVLTSATHSGVRNQTLLVPLAEQAAVALDNALLYRQTERQSLENQMLVEAGRMLLSTLDLDEVLDAILDSLQKVVPYNAGGIFLVGRDGRVERIVDRGYAPEKETGASPLENKARRGLVGWVAANGKPLIVDDVRQDARYAKARELMRSEMVVPIFAGDRLMGVLNIERDLVSGFFEADMDLVSAFAQHAGVALERARIHAAVLEQRRIKGELEVARQIQTTFLPGASPKIAGFDIAGVNIPSAEVGGDYYDFIDIIDGQIGIAIADVAGKGIPASLIMASFRASLIAEIRNNYALRSIMQKVNRLLCERNDQARFVTAIYGVLDTKNRIFTFSNAGHPPGILRRADGTILFLKEGGTALGLFENSIFEERAIGLSPGDVILLYTDGVTEMVGKDGSMYDMTRLTDLVRANSSQSAEQIVSAVRTSLQEFADPNAPVDDVTMLVVCVR